MEEHSFFDKMMINLRSTCKYYTGYPKDLGPSRVIHFTSEREFIHLLHQGHPVIVAFTIKSNYTKHLDKVLEEAAAEFYPQIKFMRVECPKYIGFCMTRQKKDYPFLEMFHSPEQTNNQGRAADPNVTKYAVKVLPCSGRAFNFKSGACTIDGRSFWLIVGNCIFGASYLVFLCASIKVTSSIRSSPSLNFSYNYDVSAYGFKEFFKRHNIQSSNNK